MSRLAALLIAAALALPASASAKQRIELKPKEPGAIGLELWGEYRIQGTARSDFAVDADGNTVGQPWSLDQRIRLGVALQLKSLTIGTEWDLLSGQMAGPLWDLPADIDARHRGEYAVITPRGFVPRRAALTWKRDRLILEAGLITSDWGLGMLANSGDREPVFGRNDFGDRNVRVRLTGLPKWKGKGALAVTAAFDWVIDDDFGAWADRELAVQAIGSLLWRPDKVRARGAYVVYRHQRDLLKGRTTDAAVIDGYVQEVISAGDAGELRFGAEAALIVGRTNAALSYNSREALTALSGGFIADGAFALPGDVLVMRMRGGFASGDSNPDDGFSGTFGYDRDTDVGMVLFDEVRGAIDVATWRLLTDPENSGQAPDGVDTLVREGAVAGAAWVQPVLQVQPLPFLGVRTGMLIASVSSIAQHPFYGYRAGGVERTHLDTPVTARGLGIEFDWAVNLGMDLPVGGPDALHPELVIQGGHARLGGALGNADWVHLAMATARFRF